MCVADPTGTTCYFEAMAHVGGNIILARRKFVLDRGREALWERVLHQRAIELSGGNNVLVRETKCRSRGCEYHCSWE